MNLPTMPAAREFQRLTPDRAEALVPFIKAHRSIYDGQFNPDVPPDVLGDYFIHDLRQKFSEGVWAGLMHEPAGGGFAAAVFHHSAWDTNFFGFRMDRLDYLFGSHENAMDAVLCRYAGLSEKEGVRHISARVNMSDRRTASVLRQNGFAEVCVKSLWRHSLADPAAVQVPSPHIRAFSPQDGDDVRVLAATLAGAGRFSMDGRFDPKRVREMYEQWAVHLCETAPAQVLVARVRGATAGFLVFTVGVPLYGAPDVADLKPGVVTHVAVDPSLRGRGFGRALIVAGLKRMCELGARAAYAATAAGNAAGAAAFQSAGFRPVTSHWDFHRWLD